MTPRSFEGIGNASTEIRKYLILNEEQLPEHLHDRLMGLTDTGTSPVDLTVNFAEAVYGNQAEFKAEAKELAAGAAILCEAFGFHGLAEKHRGSLMAKVLAGGKVASASRPDPRVDLQPKPAEVEPEPAQE